MSSVPCRWGVKCTRPDCWYVHPDGRVNAAPANSGPSLLKPHIHSPVSTSSSFGSSPKSTGGVRNCRFGRACHRPDCWFNHPDGRESDDQKGRSDGKANRCDCCKGNPLNCTTETCVALGMCGCQWEDDGGADPNIGEPDDTWRDEWFPDHRECKCCKGYIYRCEKSDPMCHSGSCVCSTSKGKDGAGDNANAGADTPATGDAAAPSDSTA